jgi:hypothetical protein
LVNTGIQRFGSHLVNFGFPKIIIDDYPGKIDRTDVDTGLLGIPPKGNKHEQYCSKNPDGRHNNDFYVLELDEEWFIGTDLPCFFRMLASTG